MRTTRRSVLVGSAMALVAATSAACDDRTAIVDSDPRPNAQAPDASTGAPATAGNLDTAGAVQTDGTGNAGADVELVQDVMARWNAAAAATSSTFDFHWAAFEQFPHPTYKGGSAQAYQDFAAVLLAFFQAGDTFDFLAHHHLFTLHLTYTFPSGQSGLDTTLQALVTSFANPDGFGNVPSDVRQALRDIADRISSAAGAPRAPGDRS
jgi:hypothetical protein